MSIFHTRASGKLLLTGEYFVLDGALALALPVRYGQSLTVFEGSDEGVLHWESLGHDGKNWFEATFNLPDLSIISSGDEKTATTLQQILRKIKEQNPVFLTEKKRLHVKTQNDFPREWGLGTSSTLIAALSKWANVNPYPVLFETMGGSGYDIACAYSDSALLYRLESGEAKVQNVEFVPTFAHQLYFIFLGKKQDSREGIRRYRQKVKENQHLTGQITQLTERFLAAESLAQLEAVINEHEHFVGQILELPLAKDLYFPDFWGAVKSLGAWGGDFVMATSAQTEAETLGYFKEKGFEVFRFLNFVK